MQRALGEPARPVEIVVGTFDDPSEAAAAQRTLEAIGIHARLTTVASASLATERIRYAVAVAPPDSRTAIQALQERMSERGEPATAIDRDQPIEEPPPPVACPECGSESTTTMPLGIVGGLAAAGLALAGSMTIHADTFYLAAVIIAAIAFLGPNRKCRRCGNKWAE